LAISKRREKFVRVTLGIGKRWFDKDGAFKGATVSFYTLIAAAPIVFFSLLVA
jgi:uncharacterized BrkB/YihY/UPF0761 family membrane protein